MFVNNTSDKGIVSKIPILKYEIWTTIQLENWQKIRTVISLRRLCK